MISYFGKELLDKHFIDTDLIIEWKRAFLHLKNLSPGHSTDIDLKRELYSIVGNFNINIHFRKELHM